MSCGRMAQTTCRGPADELLKQTADGFKAAARLGNFGHMQREISTHQHNFAFGNNAVAHHQFDRLADVPIQR